MPAKLLYKTCTYTNAVYAFAIGHERKQGIMTGDIIDKGTHMVLDGGKM